MRKVLYLLFLFGFFGYLNVSASACQGTELTRLRELADNVKINYEVETRNVGQVKDYIKITIYNLNKDFYILQKNDKDSDVKTINYTSEGKYSFSTDNTRDYVTYTFELYSNVSACDTTLIKTITFKKPKLNPNWEYQICAENPTVPVCQKYITEDTGVSPSGLKSYVENYLANQVNIVTTPTNNKSNGNFFKDNLTYILIGGGAVVVIAGVYILISKKRSAL